MNLRVDIRDLATVLALPVLLCANGCTTSSSTTPANGQPSAEGGSSSATEGGTTPPTESDGSTSDAAGDAPTGSTLDGGTSGDAGQDAEAGVNCAGKGSNSACQQCCASLPPVDSKGLNLGYETFANTLYACGCADAGVCNTVATCQSWCGNMQSQQSQACVDCLDGPAQVNPEGGAGPCQSQIYMACNKDPNCVAWNSCIAHCPRM